MAIRFRTVSQSKHSIRFSGRINSQAVQEFMPVLESVASRNYKEIVLDLRDANRAYPDGVLPIICILDQWRARGHQFRVLLPEAAMLRQLFLNANWGHFLDPSSHPKIDMQHPQHLAARRYSTHPEQQEAVSAVLDVVLRTLDLRRDVISALEWTINEITDNVLNHAKAPAGGLVELNTFSEERKITFVVADGGRGIPVAMRERFTHLNDAAAIDEAVKQGVTSIPESGQGNGLAGSLRIAKYAQGSFKVASGGAQLCVFKDPRAARYKTQKSGRGFQLPGTLVMIELSTAADFDVEEALALDGAVRSVTDVVDLRYVGASGDLVLRICDEALGVGTRHAGVELRRKCMNLLNAEPTKKLILDWTDVPLVSSSFADEAVGKLFVDLGPTTFAARVGHAGTEPLVRSLLDRAVMQRVAQSMGVLGGTDG